MILLVDIIKLYEQFKNKGKVKNCIKIKYGALYYDIDVNFYIDDLGNQNLYDFCLRMNREIYSQVCSNYQTLVTEFTLLNTDYTKMYFNDEKVYESKNTIPIFLVPINLPKLMVEFDPDIIFDKHNIKYEKIEGFWDSTKVIEWDYSDMILSMDDADELEYDPERFSSREKFEEFKSNIEHDLDYAATADPKHAKFIIFLLYNNILEMDEREYNQDGLVLITDIREFTSISTEVFLTELLKIFENIEIDDIRKYVRNYQFKKIDEVIQKLESEDIEEETEYE